MTALLAAPSARVPRRLLRITSRLTISGGLYLTSFNDSLLFVIGAKYSVLYSVNCATQLMLRISRNLRDGICVMSGFVV